MNSWAEPIARLAGDDGVIAMDDSVCVVPEDVEVVDVVVVVAGLPEQATSKQETLRSIPNNQIGENLHILVNLISIICFISKSYEALHQIVITNIPKILRIYQLFRKTLVSKNKKAKKVTIWPMRFWKGEHRLRQDKYRTNN